MADVYPLLVEAPIAGRTTSGTLALVGASPNVDAIEVGINLTALTGGTAPTVRVRLDQQDSNGVWQLLGQEAVALSAVGADRFVVPTATAAITGAALRVGWTITGGPATCTFQVGVTGKGQRGGW